ncbi:MAG: hypothetical protein K2V38_03725, partial [Gemmataceae bacterium]|nr:hypothetical protein [Gemmataceae bacterium]
MAVRAMCVPLVLAVLPAAGCGTVANLARPNPGDGRVPYGGVQRDVACLERAAADASGPVSARGPEPYPRWAGVLLCAADLPFSFVGDLLTWPYAAAYTEINRPVAVPPLLFADPPPLPAVPAAQTPPGGKPDKPDP